MRQTRPLNVPARTAACKPEGSIRQSFQDSLVLDHLNLAKSIAARYSAHTHDLDDVRQVAYMGLIKASRGFDESKGVSFPAYAAPTIAGEVKRYLRDHCWVVRPPRTIQDIRRQVLARTEELTQTLQRTPSPEEVAEDLHLEPCQVREALMAGTSKRPDSLDAPTSDGRDGLQGALSAFGCPTDRLEDVLALRNAIRSLSAEDRHLLYRRYYREETQSTIAEALGMSQMQVSRKLSKILVSLQTQLLEEEAHLRDGTAP
ncbi:RNA polymerase subunit sigma-28 [Arthrobacter sp. MYb23]|uniref:sigma-70 family RNA polymerase sigma factor n=1 Tax=unclassified Arthrobacter TaxID=235627 RepID=UPI000CFD261E|nr:MULTISPECIES: sigma-70 family RNA polymerase sigma factor [unclassified Arthrobacter]PRB43719.1 RNA polymerase subunit sigma-28 [Arthrobacter sp. MYb51]PRB97326.1 RNA polymerase subunit sigma-28 [Arthrobacter sp. MYb23]